MSDPGSKTTASDAREEARPARGDLVRCKIKGDSVPAHTAYIIGWMKYAPATVALVASRDFHGVPYNVCWLTVLSSGHHKVCAKYRARYISEYGDTLLVTDGLAQRPPKP